MIIAGWHDKVSVTEERWVFRPLQALRLLQAIKIAAKEATFTEKRTFLRLLDVRVLYNGEMLKQSGGMPVQTVELELLLKGELTGGNSSPPPQCALSGDFLLEEKGTTSGRCTRNTGSMLWFSKCALLFCGSDFAPKSTEFGAIL